MAKQTPRRKARTGALIGSALVVGAGALVFLAISLEKQPFLSKATDFSLTSEIHRKIFTECMALHQQLDDLKYPHSFNDVAINLIEPLPAKDQIASALSSCITKDPRSPYAVQGEVFSSEYEGKDGDVIVLQLNFFDKTGNKVMELNHHWKNPDFEPSEPPANEDANTAPAQAPAESQTTTKPENSFQEITEEGNTDLEQTVD